MKRINTDALSVFYKSMLDKLEKKPMYKKVPSPFIVVMENGSHVNPLVTLRCEHGGTSHIIKDDGCYVLINSVSHLLGPDAPILDYRKATHWFPEAVKALGDYLKPKPIYFDDGFCDADRYMAMKPGAIQTKPETDASVARDTLKTIAKDSRVTPDVRVHAAATLLAHRDE